MKKDTLPSEIKSFGLKETSPRSAVFSVFKKSAKPLSAEDVIRRVNKSDINKVTVYRTLLSFEKAGLLRKIDLRKGAVFYELKDHHHHHIVCQKCGDLEDFDTCIGEDIIRLIKKKSKKFRIINDHAFELFGLCAACLKQPGGAIARGL